MQEKEAELRADRERMAGEMDRLRAVCEEARREAAVAQHTLALRDAALRVRAPPRPAPPLCQHRARRRKTPRGRPAAPGGAGPREGPGGVVGPGGPGRPRCGTLGARRGGAALSAGAGAVG